jgi:hypothetical protein
MAVGWRPAVLLLVETVWIAVTTLAILLSCAGAR